MIHRYQNSWLKKCGNPAETIITAITNCNGPYSHVWLTLASFGRYELVLAEYLILSNNGSLFLAQFLHNNKPK